MEQSAPFSWIHRLLEIDGIPLIGCIVFAIFFFLAIFVGALLLIK